MSSQNARNTADQVKNAGERTARGAARSPLVIAMVRAGFAARGVIYGVIGLLAIQVAINGRGKITDQTGAIATIGAQPAGHFLLILVAVGLAGYALWGLIRAVFDPFGKGSDASGTIDRLSYLISGVSYGLLLIPTLRYLNLSPGVPTTGGGSTGAAASLMTKPYGPTVLGAIALGIIAAGIIQIIKGYNGDFDMHFSSALQGSERRWATRLGRFGYIARGVVFSIVGLFLFQAALYRNPGQARGIDGALLSVAHQPYGTFLLAIVAAGLIAFGVYSLLGALWFRVKTT